MAAIQLRSQVVKSDDRPFPTYASMQLGLGEQDGQGCQLGLPAGQRFAAWKGHIADTPVGPMRAGGGKADDAIAIPRQQQRITQRQFVAPPAGLELQGCRACDWQEDEDRSRLDNAYEEQEALERERVEPRFVTSEAERR